MEKLDLSTAGKKARADYMRNWRRNNADRQRNYQTTYWERLAEKQNGKAHECKTPELQDLDKLF